MKAKTTWFDVVVITCAGFFVVAVVVVLLNTIFHGRLFDLLAFRSLSDGDLIRDGHRHVLFQCHNDRGIRLLSFGAGESTVVATPRDFNESYSYTSIGPKGNTYLFKTDNRSGRSDGKSRYFYASDMYEYNLEGGKSTKIATIDRAIGSPELSPDGSLIALVHFSSLVLVRTVDGQIAAEHDVFGDYHPNVLRWIEDNRLLAWKRYEDWRAYVVRTDTGEIGRADEWNDDERQGVGMKVIGSKKHLVMTKRPERTFLEYRGHYGTPPVVRLSLDGQYLTYVDNGTSDIIIQRVNDGHIKRISGECRAEDGRDVFLW